MDNKFLESIGVDSTGELSAVLEQLEEKQLEYFERLENVSDEAREKELKETLKKIESETAQVKRDIEAVSSSLVMDDAGGGGRKETPKKETSKKEAQKKEKTSRQKDNEIKKEIENLKKQNAEQPQKQTKPEKTQESDQGQDQSAKQQTQSSQPDKGNAQSGKDQTQSGKNDISAGLQSYHNGDYASAFKIFSALSEKKDANAQLLLARMYEKGEGTSANLDRAQFWYKSSADNGNADAQYAYAVLKLSNTSLTDNSEEVKEGMSYLEKAANQGHKDAMDRYIKLAFQGTADSHRITKAMGYCDVRSGQVKDSYDKNMYQKKKKDLKDRRKHDAKMKNAKMVPTVISMIGNVLYIVGFLYLFWGIHPNFWNKLKFLSFLPPAKEGLIIPWDTFTNWAGDFLAAEGMFGIEVLAAAAALSSIGAVSGRKKIAHVVGRFAVYAGIAVVILHIWVWHTKWKKIFVMLPKHLLAFFLPVIIGVAVGNIVKSVFKMN